MALSTDRHQAVLTVRGELDLATAPRIDDAVGLITYLDFARAAVDLSAVEFIDACGISALIRAQHVLTAAGVRLVLHDLSRPVARIADLVGLDEVMTIEAGSGPG